MRLMGHMQSVVYVRCTQLKILCILHPPKTGQQFLAASVSLRLRLDCVEFSHKSALSVYASTYIAQKEEHMAQFSAEMSETE